MLVTASLKLLEWVREWFFFFFLLEEPGTDYKPSDTSAVQKIIIDGRKDKADEGKDDELSNGRDAWRGLSFVITELTLVMSSKKRIPFYRIPRTATVLILS